MVRPPEEKVRIVLSILAGEMTVAEAARRAKLSEQSAGNWKTTTRAGSKRSRFSRLRVSSSTASTRTKSTIRISSPRQPWGVHAQGCHLRVTVLTFLCRLDLDHTFR
jgi:transposase-like protein